MFTMIKWLSVLFVVAMALTFSAQPVSAQEIEGKVKPHCEFDYYVDQDLNVAYFDARQSFDPDGGTIRKYIWDMGDGHSETGVQPHHSYPADSYYVTLMVIDDEHHHETCSEIVVIDSLVYTPVPTPTPTLIDSGLSEADYHLLETLAILAMVILLVLALAFITLVRMFIAIIDALANAFEAILEVMAVLISGVLKFVRLALKAILVVIFALLFVLGMTLAFVIPAFILIALGPAIVDLLTTLVWAAVATFGIVVFLIVAILAILAYANRRETYR